MHDKQLKEKNKIVQESPCNLRCTEQVTKVQNVPQQADTSEPCVSGYV